MGEWANGRMGDTPLIGRAKNLARRRVDCPCDGSAPVLSRSMQVAAGRASGIASLVRSRISHLSIGDGTSTERLKTGAQPIAKWWAILGAPSFSPHRSGAASPFRFQLGNCNRFPVDSSKGGTWKRILFRLAPKYQINEYIQIIDCSCTANCGLCWFASEGRESESHQRRGQ